MPSPTLRAIGATAALALAASATTACSPEKPAMSEQAIAEQAKKDGLMVEQERFLQQSMGKRNPNYKWEGYSDKLVPAKLGPNTYMFPMNLYDKQRGPDFQGYVDLTVRWPTLDAFAPGAVDDSALKDAYLDEAINIRPRYVDKVPISGLLNIRMSPHPSDKANDPMVNITQRIRGEPRDGLVPYYIDMKKLKKYLSDEGAPTNEDNLFGLGLDWYVAYETDGSPRTFIRCSPRQLKGAGLVNGRLEDTPAGVNRGMCDHDIVIEDLKLAVRITYLRAYLADWRRIEIKVRSIFEESLVDPTKGMRR